MLYILHTQDSNFHDEIRHSVVDIDLDGYIPR